MELQKENESLQVPDCRECLQPSTEAQEQEMVCRRTVLVEDLCLKVEGLWKEVSRLHSIRDGKKKNGQILSKTI